MWISEKLQENNRERLISIGTAVSAENGLIVAGEVEKRNPLCAVPYGFYGKIPVGTEVVMCEDAVIGTAKGAPVSVAEGEVCMYSKGGYILIKNNGDVIINGKRVQI